MVIVKGEKLINTRITVYKANTFGKRFLGLMLRRKPLENEALLLIPCNSIHMFFMFFSIDVIFLDKQNKVIKGIENLKPWKVVRPVKNAMACLEIPVGTIAKYNITDGDGIRL